MECGMPCLPHHQDWQGGYNRAFKSHDLFGMAALHMASLIAKFLLEKDNNVACRKAQSKPRCA